MITALELRCGSFDAYDDLELLGAAVETMLADETYPGYADEGDIVDRLNISEDMPLSANPAACLDPMSGNVTIAGCFFSYTGVPWVIDPVGAFSVGVTFSKLS